MTEEKKNSKLANLIVRSVTGVLFVAIVVAGFLTPIGMEALFALVTGLTMWEYCGLVNNNKGVRVNPLISTVAGAVFIPYLLTIVYLFISELYSGNGNAIDNWAYTMLGQMYVALPFSTINVLAFNATYGGQTVYNYIIPLSVFVFLWANDTGAYCSGSLFGKHKLFPRISPGKTWEGSIGGAVLVLAIAALAHYFLPQIEESAGLSMPQWMGLGLVIVVFGTWGDLVESLFKRTLGIKDSGNILPGHGGMLDRFDSSLMAMPAAVVYLYTLTLIAA